MKDLLLQVRVVIRTSNMKISLCHLADYVKNCIKKILHVQHGYLSSFSQSNEGFVVLS